MTKVKLSPKQKEIVLIMREGWFGEYSTLNNSSAYLATDTAKGKKVNILNFKNLEAKGIVIKVHKNFALRQFKLTELGQSIEL